MSAELGMSLDDIVANRQKERKPREPRAAPKNSGKEGKSRDKPAPAAANRSRQSNSHDDRRQNSDKPAQKRAGTKKVMVFGIGNMDEATLREVFVQGGLNVVTAEVAVGKGNAQFGVVTFARYEDAEKAIAEYDKALVDGREITVRARDEGREGSRDARPRDSSGFSNDRDAPSSSQIVVKKPSPKVRVTNLPFDIKSEELNGIFRECGRILSGSVNRGSGIVEFQNVDAAKKAIKDFDGAEVNGRVIEVSYLK